MGHLEELCPYTIIRNAHTYVQERATRSSKDALSAPAAGARGSQVQDDTEAGNAAVNSAESRDGSTSNELLVRTQGFV